MNRRSRRIAGQRAGRCGGEAPGSNGRALACLQDGNRFAQQGRYADAVGCFEDAITVQPDYAPAFANLGNALIMMERRQEAISAWRRAIALDPTYALPYSNIGIALSQQGRLDEAIGYLQRAVELKPDFLNALDNLARILLAAGQALQGLRIACRAIALGPTNETKRVFVECLSHVRFPMDEPDLRRDVLRAMMERWARPERLIGPAAGLAKRNPSIAPCIAVAVKSWPVRLGDRELWSPEQRSRVFGDRLLRALLETGPVCDPDLEHFLTMARSVALKEAQIARPRVDAEELTFWCALARQCFINEYIFALDRDETAHVERLKAALAAALASDAEVPPLWLAVIGSYVPLHSLPQAALLMARTWPPPLRALLAQQVLEPLREAADRASIPELTTIEDAVSCAVREQYEENPYPRWVDAPPSRVFDSFESYLRGLLPWSNVAGDSKGCDILVAGCGTGLQAIEVATRSTGAHVLAIDLSLASLAFARRKTRELGLTNIDYAQADIFKLAGMGRTFDVIEAGGVLHHLRDPMGGWRALLRLLRPGGFMFLGLYSEIGRKAVVEARHFIATRGYKRTSADIRRFHQEVVVDGPDLGNLLTSPDFYCTSGCRDLFFNVEEHRLSLPQIKSFLAENDLTFYGFHIDAQVLAQFRRRFPADEALSDLDCWQAFEIANPGTFSAMYQFWVRNKP